MTYHAPRFAPVMLSLLVLLPLGGCSDKGYSVPAPAAATTDMIDTARFLLANEPEGAKDVIAVREAAQDGDDVVVVGRIGGSKDPWVEGRAAFSIVDTSLLACSDREGDNCPEPWDYCCETDKLPTSKALIKFVDPQGQLLAAGARSLFSLKELQTVVIRGRAQRDEAGNLTVLADGLYVRK